MTAPAQYWPVRSASGFPTDFRKETAPLARDLHLLVELIDKAGTDSEAFALYISTCRNVYLTINGMFCDIRETFGTVSPPNGIFGSLHKAQGGIFSAAEDQLEEAGISLSALDEKHACWQRRYELQALLETLLPQFPDLDQQTLRETLYDVVDQDDRSQLASISQFLAFEPLATSEQHSLIQNLVAVGQKLRCVKECAVRIKTLGQDLKVVAGDQSANDQQATLFAKLALPLPLKQRLLDFRTWLESSAADREALIVSEALSQTESHCPPGLDILTQSEKAADLADFLRFLANHLLNATGREYSLVAKLFRPNVGRAPLPSVFLVDLSTPPPPKADSERAAVPTPVSFSQPALDKLRLAIAQPPISSSVISDTRLQYRDEADRQIASEWALLAAREAAQEAQLIIFPELFVPEVAVDALRGVATESRIGVICGVESVRIDERYANYATILIPGTPVDYRQYKKYPSNYESKNFYTKGGQRCFIHSSIGSFSVVLCSDLREFDVIAAIEGQPFLDYLVVCCCNPHSELWRHLAVADSVRFHSFVIIANWSTSGDANGFGQGSICAAPTQKIASNLEDKPRSKSVPLIKGDKVYNGSLLFHELDISALFRDREKPKRGFLSPPMRRLRINL